MSAPLAGKKAAVVGAGAVGAVLADALDRAGAEVSLLARGAHLDAIQRDGLAFDNGEEVRHLRLFASADPAELGPQDWVLLCVKSPSLASLTPTIAPLLKADTPVVAVLNGIPWWYFQGVTGPESGRRLQSLDPDGVIEAAIPAGRVIGCVIHFAAALTAPGTVRLGHGRRLILGEPDNSLSPRLHALAESLTAGGMQVEETSDIRAAIWTKLIGNASANPIAAITGQTPDVIYGEPELRRLARAAMVEAADVAEAWGSSLTMDLEARMDLGRALGPVRLSMLQDRDYGRPLELDAIVDAIVELGAIKGVSTQILQTLATLARATADADRKKPR